MMSAATTPFYGSIKTYWRRRQYQRIDGAVRNTQVIRLGGKRKRSWKIKVIPKLKLAFKIVSPLRLLKKLRDAYIKMMLGVAGNVGGFTDASFFGGKRVPQARKTSKSAEDFESKLIFEIYKALKASRELGS